MRANLISFEPGQRFGRLVVLEKDPTVPAYWLCQCDCGATRSAEGSALKHGRARSCGCLKRSVGGITQRRLASEYGITQATVSHIIARRT
jgi:hypothetical protein